MKLCTACTIPNISSGAFSVRYKEPGIPKTDVDIDCEFAGSMKITEHMKGSIIIQEVHTMGKESNGEDQD